MARKVEYYKCDCEDGKLEIIAKSQSNSDAWDIGNKYAHSTYFLECNKCGQLYFAYGNEKIEKNPLIDVTEPWMMYKYKGQLVKAEITEHVPLLRGILIQSDEAGIIAKRKATS